MILLGIFYLALGSLWLMIRYPRLKQNAETLPEDRSTCPFLCYNWAVVFLCPLWAIAHRQWMMAILSFLFFPVNVYYARVGPARAWETMEELSSRQFELRQLLWSRAAVIVWMVAVCINLLRNLATQFMPYYQSFGVWI